MASGDFIQVSNEDDEIVISGISGRFPASSNIKEYEKNLYDGVNMVDDKETRWKHTTPQVPRFSGKVPELGKFDSTFFGVHNWQVNNMDPQHRILIEEAYKAVMDAGINPISLAGSKTGVYIGVSLSEAEATLIHKNSEYNAYGLLGCCKAMFANRISYQLDLNGPSLSCDTACSSSMYALTLAYQAMAAGAIDAAIVGGSNLCLNPLVSMQFQTLGMLSPDGKCSPFDIGANGYVRSEAIGCIYLQRRSNAKRIYATLVYSSANCDGNKVEGVTFPSSEKQAKLLRQVYSTVNISMDDIGYMEAHGTGTKVGDPEECKAIDTGICSKRSSPLLIGSAKSNCGHAEAASGFCAIAKVTIAMQNNLIPANINFTKIREDIPVLMDGSLVVVNKHTPIPKKYVGINSFGFGGANVHALLRKWDKEKAPVETLSNRYSFPRLITWSSRTSENLLNFFEDLESKPLDEEYIALAHNSQLGGIQGMVYRGHMIMQHNSGKMPITLHKNTCHNTGTRRPLVWVFSGMGSQWPGMGVSLMRLPLFRESIQRCHNILKPFGLNLIEIITSRDPHMFDNITHSFVGIAAIQIALVDVLCELGLKPDFVIGHSVGELGCAYAEKNFTAEQMIIAAYYRGKISLDMNKVKGSMAAIGLSYENIRPLLPAGIEVACHNSPDSCTISGPYEEVGKFVQALKNQNIFAKEVLCSNIAFHSQYIAPFGPILLHELKQFIPNPTLRSNKWISTSVPRNQWQLPESKYSSSEYHTNNLLKSVLFEEAATYLPKNALTIEIAPHALIQSILRSNLPDGIHLPLTKRGEDDGIQLLLTSLGTLYENNVELLVDKLYPPISWPVSRGTQGLSSLIDFDHTDTFVVPRFGNEFGNGQETLSLDIKEKHSYLTGHEIDGRVLVPATFYLESVWRTFAILKGHSNFSTLSVEFQDVRFIRATTLSVKGPTVLKVNVQPGSGKFEITESDSLVATGYIEELVGKTGPNHLSLNQSESSVALEKKYFYKELKLRGYHYKGEFQGVEMALGSGTYGKIMWKSERWVPFMDCMLQMIIVAQDSRGLVLPTRLRTLRINAGYHNTLLPENGLIEVFASKHQNRIICGGIEMCGITANGVQRRRPPGEPRLQAYQFMPHFPLSISNTSEIAKFCLQLALENEIKMKWNILEIRSKSTLIPKFLPDLMSAVETLPLVKADFYLRHSDQQGPFEEMPGVIQIPCDDSTDTLTADILVCGSPDLEHFVKCLNKNAFVVLSRNQGDIKVHVPDGFKMVATFPKNCDYSALLQKEKTTPDESDTVVVQVVGDDPKIVWIEQLQTLVAQQKSVILVAQNEAMSGILGLVNCLRKESDTKDLRCVFIDSPDKGVPAFNTEDPFYKTQLNLGLAINIYRNRQWGTYRHLNLTTQEQVAVPRSGHVYSNILHIGDFSSLKWLEGPIKNLDKAVKVVYSSLNFRDIMVASGRLPREVIASERVKQASVFGFEFSGYDMHTKKRIMGMVSTSALSSYVQDDRQLSWEVPECWTLQEAASVSVVYLTVYWAFFFATDIRKGRSILIHAGSGGIGIAAIRVALSYGLKVYTTVSTPDKKSFLLKTYPDLLECDIGNSRDTSFEDMVMERTAGRGVDFVLNSLSEDKLKASVRCLAKGGAFLEIGKFDMANDNPLGLGEFLNELSFHAVMADNLLHADAAVISKLQSLMSDDIQKGVIRPLPTTVFAADEMEEAFKYLRSGKHIGKVLVQIRDNEESAVTLPMSILPQVYFSPQSVYIVPGGLGGFGLELVDWMILRGARKIVLSSSRGITNDYQQLRITLWKSYGCDVVINKSDITTEVGCLQLINEANSRGPIGGIFNLAMVLKDALFADQSAELFRAVLNPKAKATRYLDEITRRDCPDMEYFVVFSSVSCGYGNAGQSNYGMANSIMERIIENRVRDGFAGKAIQWGAIGEVGIVAELMADRIDVSIGGTLQQRISSCLDVLDTLLSAVDPVVSSFVVAEKNTDVKGASLLDIVLNLLSLKDIKSVPVNSTLAELGMDSLIGVEIKQAIERDYDITLTAADLRAMTIAKLQEISDTVKEVAPAPSSETQMHDSMVQMACFYGQIQNLGNPNVILDRINQIDSGKPIIILPGIEGCTTPVWHIIGKELNAPAYVLQLHKTKNAANIAEVVDFAVDQIISCLAAHGTKELHLIGHSVGACIACYILNTLEHKGYKCRAVFIDGSPQFVQSMMNTFKVIHGIDMNPLLITLMLSILVPPENSEKLSMEIKSRRERDPLYGFIEEYLISRNCDNVELTMLHITSTYQRILLFQQHNVFDNIGQFTAETLLIKTTEKIVHDIDNYYGLASLTNNNVLVETLEGDHQTILKNKELPKLLNDFFAK